MRPAHVALLAAVLLAAPIAARARVVQADEAPSSGGGAGMGASSSRAPAGGRVAGGYAARVRMPPPERIPPLTRAELLRTLERARREMQTCADDAGLRGANVTARITRDGALRMTVRGRPRDAGAEACIDLVARRHVTPLMSRYRIARSVSASIRLGSGPRPPAPPPRPPASVDERELHDRIDASSGTLRRCLDEAYPGMTGTVTLRVAAHRDGTMTLEGASLPPGVPAGPMLVCLQGEVARLRVTAGSERSVTHDLHLGR